jgi:hypothetical protein
VSRKNLSRTVIEGGRYWSNCWFRRQSHGEERATTREWLERVSVDLDEADATDPPPRRRVGKMFRDKLGPAQRWLESQVNRPWDNVYSELCELFDTRTVAGRHVVHDHMLKWVRQYDDVAPHYSRFDLVIDEHGILRKGDWFAQSYTKVRERARGWAQGRVAANTYRGWLWFAYEPIGGPCYARYGCAYRQHIDVYGGSYHAMRFTMTGTLTRGEIRFAEKLPAYVRRNFVIESPL